MPIHHRIHQQHQQAIEPNNQQPIIEQPIIEQLNHPINDHHIHLSETVQQAATVEIPAELLTRNRIPMKSPMPDLWQSIENRFLLTVPSISLIVDILLVRSCTTSRPFPTFWYTM